MIDTPPIPTTNPAEFGASIRAARTRHGLTQAELAAVAGVHRRVIGELERGKATVQLGIALKAAMVVGLDAQLQPRPTTNPLARYY